MSATRGHSATAHAAAPAASAAKPQATTQQAPPGKIDVNNALVTDYKTLQGMYPHAAGLIASNGPYNSVRDLNNIPGVTPNDRKLFAKYSDQFTALPPTRQFYERINARQST